MAINGICGVAVQIKGTSNRVWVRGTCQLELDLAFEQRVQVQAAVASRQVSMSAWWAFFSTCYVPNVLQALKSDTFTKAGFLPKIS